MALYLLTAGCVLTTLGMLTGYPDAIWLGLVCLAGSLGTFIAEGLLERKRLNDWLTETEARERTRPTASGVHIDRKDEAA